MAAEGATVWATDVNGELLKSYEGVANVHTAVLNVLDKAAIQKQVAAMTKIDIVFNCAGFVHNGTILEANPFLGRIVTSYVPQAQVKKLGTRFTSITWVGDVITVSGKVTGKREENGQKLVDLEVKCTNQNGQDTLQGDATVVLN